MFTVWSLHIDDNDTFETTLHVSREEAVAARRAYVVDNEFEHTVSLPNE